MAKRSLSLLITSVLLTTTLLVMVLFAWFNLSQKTPPIIIVLGTIELDAHLYDVETPDNVEIETLTIDKVIPGSTYDYLITTKNTGTLTGDLTILFEFESNNESLLNYVIFEYLTDAYRINTFYDAIKDTYTYEISGIELMPSTVEIDNTMTFNFNILIDPDLTKTTLDEITEPSYVRITSIKFTLRQQA